MTRQRDIKRRYLQRHGWNAQPYIENNRFTWYWSNGRRILRRDTAFKLEVIRQLADFATATKYV